jgi:hypothetical protein
MDAASNEKVVLIYLLMSPSKSNLLQHLQTPILHLLISVKYYLLLSQVVVLMVPNLFHLNSIQMAKSIVLLMLHALSNVTVSPNQRASLIDHGAKVVLQVTMCVSYQKHCVMLIFKALINIS